MSIMKDIKTGNKVLLKTGSFGYPEYSIETVERTTNTTIFVEGKKYRMADGRLIGHTKSWSPTPVISAASMEDISRVNKINMAKRINDFRFRVTNDDPLLDTIYDFLTQHEFLTNGK